MSGLSAHLFTLSMLGALGTLGLVSSTPPAVRATSPRPSAAPGFVEAALPGRSTELVVGTATFYGSAFHGQVMANGRVFDMYNPFIAASNRWPLGTVLRVRRLPGCPWDSTLTDDELSLYRAQAITVVVSDRGAFTHELDLSYAAFARLGRPDEGRLLVSIEVLSGEFD